MARSERILREIPRRRGGGFRLGAKSEEMDLPLCPGVLAGLLKANESFPRTESLLLGTLRTWKCVREAPFLLLLCVHPQALKQVRPAQIKWHPVRAREDSVPYERRARFCQQSHPIRPVLVRHVQENNAIRAKEVPCATQNNSAIAKPIVTFARRHISEYEIGLTAKRIQEFAIIFA